MSLISDASRYLFCWSPPLRSHQIGAYRQLVYLLHAGCHHRWNLLTLLLFAGRFAKFCLRFLCFKSRFGFGLALPPLWAGQNARNHSDTADHLSSRTNSDSNDCVATGLSLEARSEPHGLTFRFLDSATTMTPLTPPILVLQPPVIRLHDLVGRFLTTEHVT